MVKKKVSLSGREGSTQARAKASPEVLELFFNTGIVFHDLAIPALADTVSSFKLMKDAAGAVTVRRAEAGEEPDVEIAAVDHLRELAHRWLPVPYQLSAPFAVQVWIVPRADDPRSVDAVLAIDTLERAGTQGKHLDAQLDGGRPFRPLDRTETSAFLDHSETRELVRRMEKSGVERPLFKLAALLDVIGPSLPRIRFSRVQDHAPIDVSLVLDVGNSRTTAVLVEARDKGVFALPLEMRASANPLEIHDDAFDSRVTFLPSAFDRGVAQVAVGESFTSPSVVKMGREALDRALETPHRYLCTLSGPKRYLWDGRLADERWHYATPIDPTGTGPAEHKPVFGRLLKHIVEEGGGLSLRDDGPSAPADPRYPPRTIMLFALVEIVSQALAQVNGIRYRSFQGKEQNPRVLRHVALTFPSAMRDEEKAVYESLARNAVHLACHLLNIGAEHRPNFVLPQQAYEPFLFTDEALAAQMVYVYQEIQHAFGGSFEDLVAVYGKKGATLRVASVDIGGGTSDVMIAEYTDKQPGVGTSLGIRKLFQDGVSIAGDEVCRAILEEVVFAQIVQQLEVPAARAKLAHLFAEGDAGLGASWRTLRAKLVPYFWMPLARCYWALAEGFELEDHNPDKLYGVADIFKAFEAFSFSPRVASEADKLITTAVPGFPGLMNLFLRLDRAEVETAALSVMREPLRRYADIMAQFDVDVLVLAGRTSALPCIRGVFVAEGAVPPARIKTMASYRVGEWYPSKWQDGGHIRDPKSTVTAGAAILHLASKNKIPGFLLDEVREEKIVPIYGLYNENEAHISRDNELFRNGKTSAPFLYTNGMLIGFRNVDSPEMDASPLFEVRPANADVAKALLEDRVNLRFGKDESGRVQVAEVKSQREIYSFTPEDFVLALRTITSDRYWLDSGVFKGLSRYA